MSGQPEFPPPVRTDKAKTGRIATTKAQAQEQVEKAQSWVDRHRPHMPILDLVLRCYERDRDTDAAIVGSALALRVFLFFVPITLVIVGVLGFVGDHVSTKDASEQVGVTGGLADQIDSALRQGTTARWLLLLTGLFGAAWAGRTLSKTLVIASRRAWLLPTRERIPSIKVLGAVAGIIGTIGLLAIVTNRIRRNYGTPIGITMLLACAAAYALAWFFVCNFLPRARSDPSALLPGALLTGIGIALMQGATQFFATDQLSHASQLYGSLGAVIVTLGWFFIIGRLFIASFIFNACTFERFGSLSEFVFGLPLINRIPKRWPRIARWMGLHLDDNDPDEPEAIEPGG
jgi:uncharacterized BrkB/YihY/UPF0761 family membrane protein